MKALVGKMVHSVLIGEDYRPYVLATINKRFIDQIFSMMPEVLKYKAHNDNWLIELMKSKYRESGKESKMKLLWYGGLNNKTVKNMKNTTSKDVVLEACMENIESFDIIFSEIGANLPDISIQILLESKSLSRALDMKESFLFMNTVSAMKASLQGGAWSEVGKITERVILLSIFKLLEIPEDSYVLDNSEMIERNLVDNREIDGIVFDKDGNILTIELKLLGIGNPEIGDEALARGVDLFLIDRLTDMMKEEMRMANVKVIEFRPGNSIKEIYDFLVSKNVECVRPKIVSSTILLKKIEEIIEELDSVEELDI